MWWILIIIILLLIGLREDYTDYNSPALGACVSCELDFGCIAKPYEAIDDVHTNVCTRCGSTKRPGHVMAWRTGQTRKCVKNII